jgi:YfiH family protein
MNHPLTMLTAPVLASLPRVAHGFFGRTGGASKGVYATLNCGPGSGDDAALVRENRARAMAALDAGADDLLTLHQIHSASAVTVTEGWAMGEGPQADAMATRRDDLVLGILTADCAPILLADAEAGVIGAAHAGWQGALDGIIDAVVMAMEELGASRGRISAAIGPCISQDNYEVGPEFFDRFRALDDGSMPFFIPAARAGHHQFDLPGYVALRLARAGVNNVQGASVCTYADEETFFSYRRNTHAGTSQYGRNLSAIRLRSVS